MWPANFAFVALCLVNLRPLRLPRTWHGASYRLADGRENTDATVTTTSARSVAGTVSSGLREWWHIISISQTSAVSNDLDAPFFVWDTHRVDLLQEHLIRARATGGVFARSAANPPWGLQLSDIQLAVHAVIQGRLWLWTADDNDAVELGPGDLAFVRGKSDHFVAHEPGAPCVGHDEFRLHHAVDDAKLSPHGAVFLCGAYQFAGDIGTGLVDALPPVFAFRADVADPLHSVLTLLSHEMAHAQPGQQTVLDRLLDVLVVLGLRTGLARSLDAPAWFRALNDERLSRALQAIHESPERPWTVAELADVALMSRASLARNFQKTLRQTPMQYLLEWRMTLARDLLLAEGLSLAQVADRVGYSSPYAFATALSTSPRRGPGTMAPSAPTHPSRVAHRSWRPPTTNDQLRTVRL